MLIFKEIPMASKGITTKPWKYSFYSLVRRQLLKQIYQRSCFNHCSRLEMVQFLLSSGRGYCYFLSLLLYFLLKLLPQWSAVSYPPYSSRMLQNEGVWMLPGQGRQQNLFPSFPCPTNGGMHHTWSLLQLYTMSRNYCMPAHVCFSVLPENALRAHCWKPWRESQRISGTDHLYAP